MTPDEDAIARVAGILDRLGVPYMVTGSVASSHHGRPRMTQDVDVVADPTPPALTRFVEEVASLGFYVDADTARDALARRRQFTIIEPRSASKIDVIIRKDRPFSHGELSRRQVVLLGGGPRVGVASPEDTILSKLEWARKAGGSEKQLADAAGIVAVQGDALDHRCLDRWAEELSVSDLWEQVRGGT